MLTINSVFDNVVAAMDLVIIVEADLNLQISKKLVRAKEVGSINDYVIGRSNKTSNVCTMTISHSQGNGTAFNATLRSCEEFGKSFRHTPRRDECCGTHHAITNPLMIFSIIFQYIRNRAYAHIHGCVFELKNWQELPPHPPAGTNVAEHTTP